ncbi:MAG: hypothetical protein HYR55_18655 [Acidobacteria bacterium]|nr:hypothetical protein [Acidobacteriota bacterium]MBI3655037.1 hypothetical protein [Acidobacteriota bacterium]
MNVFSYSILFFGFLVSSLLLPLTTPVEAADVAGLPGVIRLELAGNALEAYPYFEYVRAINQGSTVAVAVDPIRYPEVAGRRADLYIVAHKTETEWAADPQLTDVRGGPQSVTFTTGDIRANTFLVDSGLLSGNADIGLGVPYDVVLDFNANGRLDSGDYIDGLGDEAGFYVVAPTQLPGPLAVSEIRYTGGSFLGQVTYYPTDLTSMGQLPLVVVSHGNGHNYLWYDHIGRHLASYGYIVMSHQNNTGPGIETASTTTLTNTDYLLGNQATIAGGVLDGHIDSHQILWIGHSRGGEGVVRAYDRIYRGSYSPVNFQLEDIILISSIAPTDFLGPGSTNPHGVAYHLWVGAADADVNGCANCSLCQPFHLLDRATGVRQSTSLYGVGHGAFHNGSGGLVATGPCLLTRPETHQLMKGYLLPLVKRYTEGNIPAKDFLWRPYEKFHPDGVPTHECVVVNLEYNEGAESMNFVVDDFQSPPSTSISSSGGAVTYDVENLTKGVLHDRDGTFTWVTSDPMNGMTVGGASDSTRGIVFEWNNADRTLSFEIVPERTNLSGFKYFSFRAAQATRHPLTIIELASRAFTVLLRDGNGVSSSINIGALGGAIAPPYQRTGCGTGAGWGNEFETIRLRLSDFLNNGSGLDLTNVVAVDFEFGPSYGSAYGRIGLDDVEFTLD